MPSDIVPVLHSDPGAWTSVGTYPLGAQVRPTVPNGLYYTASHGGTSGGVEPAWPLIVGNTVNDGTGLVWTCTNDLNSITGTPVITIPLNGDTGVPQAIVAAIGMLTDWFLAVGFLKNSNTWAAVNTFNSTVAFNGAVGFGGATQVNSGATLTIANGATQNVSGTENIGVSGTFAVAVGATLKNQGVTAAGVFGYQTTLASAGIQLSLGASSSTTLATFTPAADMAIRVDASLVSTTGTPQTANIFYKDGNGTSQNYTVAMVNSGSGSGSYYPQFVTFIIYAKAGTAVTLNANTVAAAALGIGSLTGI